MIDIINLISYGREEGGGRQKHLVMIDRGWWHWSDKVGVDLIVMWCVGKAFNKTKLSSTLKKNIFRVSQKMVIAYFSSNLLLMEIFKCISISRPGFVSHSVSQSEWASWESWNLLNLSQTLPCKPELYQMVPYGTRWYPMVRPANNSCLSGILIGFSKIFCET